MRGVDVTVCILSNSDHIGDRFAPGQFIAVMLEWTNKDYGSILGSYVGTQGVLGIKVGGDANIENANESIDSGR